MSTLLRKWFPKNQGHSKIDLQTGFFTLDKIKIATKNFDSANRIGGFGSVYKGKLSDGTHIAVKKLSSHSKKGCREFINEIGMISALEHPNIVKLYGGCMDKEQLLLVYEYVENSSLSHALFGEENSQLRLDWRTRKKICGGIARGLAYLHEESRLKIVHRDIKATNVLLDKHLNPKISDFGLARLNDVEKTHISTRIAGTLGYMAPEYIRHGYLTDKADVYSFGIVMLETISGKRNTLSLPEEGCLGLVYKANILLERGTLLDIVDSKLGLNYNRDEAIKIIKISLLCTNSIPTLRPSMSNVVKMLEGREDIREPISNVSSVIDRSLYDVCQERLQSLEKGDFSLNVGDRSPPYLDARLNSRASSQYLLDYQI